jgi:hypothetical protein
MTATVELRNVADNREHSLQVDVFLDSVNTLLACVRDHWQLPRSRLVLAGALLNDPSKTLHEAGIQDASKVVVFVAPIRAPPTHALPTNVNNGMSDGEPNEQQHTWAGGSGGSRLGGVDDITRPQPDETSDVGLRRRRGGEGATDVLVDSDRCVDGEDGDGELEANGSAIHDHTIRKSNVPHACILFACLLAYPHWMLPNTTTTCFPMRQISLETHKPQTSTNSYSCIYYD